MCFADKYHALQAASYLYTITLVTINGVQHSNDTDYIYIFFCNTRLKTIINMFRK